MMNKMLMIAYNEAIDPELMEAMQGCGLKNYTKLTGVFGRGEASGTHLGNDIWPGRNNLLFIACEEKAAKQLLERVRELRKRLGAEGAKAFVFPLEEIT